MVATLHSARADTQIRARQASGYAESEGQRRNVSSCFFEKRETNGAVVLKLASDPESALEFEVAETLPLPLKEGVIPTYQQGLEIVYEDGRLTFRWQREAGLDQSFTELSFELSADMQTIKQASAWQKEFKGLPRNSSTTQELHCEF